MLKWSGGELLISQKLRLSRSLIGACGILALASFLAYSPSLRAGFIYDDPFFITYNSYIKDLGNFWSFFTEYRSSSPLGHDLYRPLRTASYAVEYKIWELNPFGYHLGNILLHSANVILTFIALRLLLRRQAISFALALFFAFHPANADAVAWVSSRGDLMAYFFVLSSFIFHVLSSSWGEEVIKGAPRSNLSPKAFYAASVLAFGAALLSKESAIVAAALIIVFDICFARGKLLSRGSARYLPYLGAAGIYLLARYEVVGGFAQGAYWGGSPYISALTTAKAFAYYFKLLSFPTGLRLIYDVQLAKSLLDPKVIASLGILAAFFFCAFYFWWSAKGGFFGLAWFGLMLLPVSNIIPIKGLMAEHYLYLPMFGFLVALGFSFLSLDRLQPFRARPSAQLAISFICLILIFNLALLVKRNLLWVDEEWLWRDTVAKAPNRYVAHYNLGNIFVQDNRIDKAAMAYFQAFKLDPSQPEPHNNLGVIMRKRGLTLKGARHFQAATALKADYADAHFNLGNAMESLYSGDKAMAQYAFAIVSDASFYKAHNNMGVRLFTKGLLDKAGLKYKTALALEPSFAEAHYNSGLLFLKKGEREKSLEAFAKFKINCACDSEVLDEVEKLTSPVKGSPK